MAHKNLKLAIENGFLAIRGGARVAHKVQVHQNKMPAAYTIRPIFEIGDIVKIAHGIENSEGFTNSEYLPSGKDESIGAHVEILEILASNGKRIEACYNPNMNSNLKLFVELSHHGRSRLPKEFWIKAVDVVNYRLLGWSEEHTNIYESTKDKDLSWMPLFSELENGEDLQGSFQFVPEENRKDVQKSTKSLVIQAKKVYRKQFYHLVQVHRIQRWQQHVDFANKNLNEA